MGSINPQGFYVYDHTDQDATAADMLNRQTEALSEQPFWQPLALDGAAAGTLEYALARGDVLLRGTISTNIAASGTLKVAMLPAAILPGMNFPVDAYATGAMLAAIVLGNGEVRIQNHSSTTSTNSKFIAGRWPKNAV